MFYFPKESPWLPLFFETILEMHQSGVFAWMERRWNINNPEPNESCVKEQGLGYDRTILLFTILGLGAIASISTVSMEKLASKIALNNQQLRRT